jgi:HEAT repeat protein
MSIEIHCQTCDKRYRVKADLAGKRVRCSNCGNPVAVPGADAGADIGFVPDPLFENSKRPAPPKAAPPPVPRQVVRFDPRFDPQASDHPAPPPPAKPQPKQAPQRTPQPARKNQADSGREIRFVDDDPLFMNKPKTINHDNLADTADGPAMNENSPEPRLDDEPVIPRGKRSASKLADTAAPPSDEPDLDIAPPDEMPAFGAPSENTAMRRIREQQAAGKERRCTGCGAVMKVGAIICLNCGFNSATGERGSGPPADWEDPGESKGGWSKWFGKADWKPEDKALRRLCIFGVIVCLFPLIGLKVPQLIKPGMYIAWAGLALSLLSAALFAKRMHITRAAVAAGAALVAFAVYSSFRPLESDDQLARNDDAPKHVIPQIVKPTNNGPRVKPPANDGASTEVMKILQGPAEGIDPMNWHLSYLSHADARVRFNSAQKLLEITPAGRKEEVAKAFEARLNDEHPNVRRLAIKGVCLYIDDHTTSLLTPLLKDEEEDVRKDVYQVLAKLKDAKALPAIVARLSDDGALAREALAAFDASQRPAITRAFELSLKNDNPRQRELAARELATYGGPNTPGLLLGLLDDGDVGVRCAAVVTLGKLKEPRTLDAIVARLPYDRAAAMSALEAFGPAAEKQVLSLLKNGNTDMRIAAAEVLASVGTKDSIPALHDAALDTDVRLSATAKEAWGKIAPDEFTAGMEAAVDMESDNTSRQKAALERLAELKPDKSQDRVARMLVRMALSEDITVREEAYKVLPTWGTKDTALAFIDFLTEKTHPARRQMAEMALGALRDPRGAQAVARWAVADWPTSMQALADMGPVAEESVIELLMHERVDVRREAVKALKMWGSKQKAVPALQALLTLGRERERNNLERFTLEKDIIEAVQTIRERPNVPRKPVTQPGK